MISAKKHPGVYSPSNPYRNLLLDIEENTFKEISEIANANKWELRKRLTAVVENSTGHYASVVRVTPLRMCQLKANRKIVFTMIRGKFREFGPSCYAQEGLRIMTQLMKETSRMVALYLAFLEFNPIPVEPFYSTFLEYVLERPVQKVHSIDEMDTVIKVPFLSDFATWWGLAIGYSRVGSDSRTSQVPYKKPKLDLPRQLEKRTDVC